MEALGGAATIIGVIETAAALFKTCLQYSLAVKDAKRDIQRLQSEATDVQNLLARVADLASEPRANELPALGEVLAPGGPLQTCGIVMQELLDQLDGGRKEMRRFGMRALKWPFKSEDVDKTLVVLERCKASFSLALAADTVKLALDTNQETKDYRKGQYKEKIVAWLAEVEAGVSWSNHEDARKKHEPETGAWLLDRSDVYQQWKKEVGEFLWIWGMPGCGKTIMISSIIEDLRALVEDDSSNALAYFYFDFGTPAKQNVLNCARYILSRLVSQGSDEISPELKTFYTKKCNYGHEEPTLEDLTFMIELLASGEDIKNLFVVLDGLDEAPLKDGKREELLDWLVNLVDKLGDRLHLCASSRLEVDIKDKLASLDDLIEIRMDEEDVGRDIILYVQKALSTHIKLKKLPGALKAEIQDTLFSKAQGMFRWVDCQLDELKRCKTKPQVVQALRNLPSSLPATYERIIEAILEEDVEYARRALWWLVTSRRPLTVEELAEAAVIDAKTDPAFHADYRFFDTREQLLEILGSLVTVTSTAPSLMENPDPLTPASAILPVETVRLSHFSVQEYLLSDGLRESKNERLRMFAATQQELEAYLSESSLQYLHCYIESEDRLSSIEDTAEFPLLCYAAQRWPTHFQTMGDAVSDNLISLVISLLQEQATREAWLQIYAPNQPRKKLFTVPDEIGHPLHYAAMLGLNEVLIRLAPPGCPDIDCTTESGITPLIKCAYNPIDTLKTLVTSGADLNAQTRGGRSALHEAARKGSLLATHHLVRAGAKVDLGDGDGWTAFYYACESNRMDVARYMLQDRHDPKVAAMLDQVLDAPFDTPLNAIPKADPGYRTNSGGSPLHQVAGWGYVDVVALLLAHGAPVNIATVYGRTPLHQAAGGGSTQVVKMLVEAGADVHATDMSGFTARELAEDGGHLDLADLLEEMEGNMPRPRLYYGEESELESVAAADDDERENLEHGAEHLSIDDR